VERPSAQRRQAERRRLWDRRSPVARRAGEERRSRERRSGAQAHPAERRAGPDRRGTDRRSVQERRTELLRRRGRRRRDTPTPYTAEEIVTLRERFAAPGPVACPACESRFSLGPSRRRGGESARRVVCLGCGRGAVVTNSRAARILVVEQHDGLREILQAMLTGAGHDVIEAPDAGVALSAYQTVPADVIILDVLAPGRMEAPEFLRRLRRFFPEARVVAMAGRPSYTGSDPLAVAQGLGAARTIRMPVSRDELLKIVEEVRQ
jgi:CheY-like chemotaxis protein